MQLTAGSHQHSAALLVGYVAWQRNMALHQGPPKALGLPHDTAGTLIPAAGAGQICYCFESQVAVPAVHGLTMESGRGAPRLGWPTSGTALCEATGRLAQLLATSDCCRVKLSSIWRCFGKSQQGMT